MVLLRMALLFVRDLFRNRGELALENLALRQQLAVLQSKKKRPESDKWTASSGFGYRDCDQTGVQLSLSLSLTPWFVGTNRVSSSIGVGNPAPEGWGDRRLKSKFAD